MSQQKLVDRKRSLGEFLGKSDGVVESGGRLLRISQQSTKRPKKSNSPVTNCHGRAVTTSTPTPVAIPITEKHTSSLVVDFGNVPSLRASCASRQDHLRGQQLRILDLVTCNLSSEEKSCNPSGNSEATEAVSARVHLQEISRYLTRLPHDSLTSAAAMARFSNTRDVAVLCRAWEEKFLHEPSGNERPCVNRASRSCFASKIINNGIRDKDFGLCEFYTQPEYESIRKSGFVWPVALSPCLLCLRAEAFARFLEARCNGVGCASNVNYASISNIVGQTGEYLPESCFLSSSKRYEGIVDPIVIPNVRDYEMTTVCGIRHLRQLHPKPEHVVSKFFFFDKTKK